MKNCETIQNQKQLEEAVKEYASVDRELTKAEADMNKEIDGIKNKYKAKTASLQGNKKSLGILIESYAEEHKTELLPEGRKSIELPTGILGWNKSSSIVYSNSQTAQIVQRLKDMGHMTAISIKETPDKEALAKWSNEALAEIGVRRDEKDKFFITVNTAELSA